MNLPFSLPGSNVIVPPLNNAFDSEDKLASSQHSHLNYVKNSAMAFSLGTSPPLPGPTRILSNGMMIPPPLAMPALSSSYPPRATLPAIRMLHEDRYQNAESRYQDSRILESRLETRLPDSRYFSEVQSRLQPSVLLPDNIYQAVPIQIPQPFQNTHPAPNSPDQHEYFIHDIRGLFERQVLPALEPQPQFQQNQLIQNGLQHFQHQPQQLHNQQRQQTQAENSPLLHILHTTQKLAITGRESTDEHVISKTATEEDGAKKRRGRPRKLILDPSTNEYIDSSHENYKRLNKILLKESTESEKSHGFEKDVALLVAQGANLGSLNDQTVKQLLEHKDRRGRPRKFPIEQTGVTIKGIRVNGSSRTRRKSIVSPTGEEEKKTLLEQKDTRGRPRKYPIEQTGVMIKGTKFNGADPRLKVKKKRGRPRKTEPPSEG